MSKNDGRENLEIRAVAEYHFGKVSVYPFDGIVVVDYDASSQSFIGDSSECVDFVAWISSVPVSRVQEES